MVELREHLIRKMSHADKRVKSIKRSHGDKAGSTHTYHGGWSLGYWEGKLSTYEDLLDLLIKSDN